MIDFTELPQDGVKFEQLVREILLRSELEVHWTGVGADGGRDLIAIERAAGGLAPFERRWLVSCKHFAASGKSVAPTDVQDIPGICTAADATGFLLACSTQPSSATVKRLEETENNSDIVCRYWDGIEIEKRLDSPSTFPLLSLFFPKSAALTPWKIYNSMRPSLWAANYKDYFLYLACRISNTFPRLTDVEEIVARIESIPLPEEDDPEWAEHYMRIRAVYYDNKHEQFSVFVDYLYPEGTKRKLKRRAINDVLRDGDGLYSDEESTWYLTHWDVRYVETHQMSDRFHIDEKRFYEPYMGAFQVGLARRQFLHEELGLDRLGDVAVIRGDRSITD